MPKTRSSTQVIRGLEKTGNRKGNQRVDKTVSKSNVKSADRHISTSVSLKSTESMERKGAGVTNKVSAAGKREKEFIGDSDEEIKNSGATSSRLDARSAPMCHEGLFQVVFS